jgi:hypothetical protein
MDQAVFDKGRFAATPKAGKLARPKPQVEDRQ